MTTVISIDGPAGAGKSTVAKKLAQHLKFFYLDTGAMYRALTLKALRQKVRLEDEKSLVTLARQTSIDFKESSSQGIRVILDGEDVSEAIRSQEVTNYTFYIARTAGVRRVMVEWQRRIGVKHNVVVEGRDIGTVVFPKAQKKFYLDANFAERVRRRIKELEDKGEKIEAAKLKKELKERDHKDLTRSAGPLKKADDAIVIDSTNLTVKQVVAKMLVHIKGHTSKVTRHK